VGQDTFTVQPESFFALPVSFTPSEAIPYTDVLTITSDDPDYPAKTVALQGQGLPVTAGELSLPFRPTKFPLTAIGDTSTVFIPVFNSGTQAVIIDSIVVNGNEFSTEGNNITISVGETYNLPVSFYPDSIRIYRKGFYIYRDSQSTASEVFSVRGDAYEGFFNVIPSTGQPYSVILDTLIGPEDSVGFGDEIGIFDGSTAVGVIAVISGSSNSGENISALSFDGNDDYVEVPNTNDIYSFVGSWTVEAWVKPSQSSSSTYDQPIVWKVQGTSSNEDNYYLGWGGSSPGGDFGQNKFSFGTESSNNDNDYAVGSLEHQPGEFYYVAGVYDGNELKIYVNGILEGTNSIGLITPYSGSAPLRIGDNRNTNHQNGTFDGIIDEVRLWNRALSSVEIESNFTIPVSGGETGIVGYWNFNEGSGTVASDLSYYNNHGTIFGASWSSDAPVFSDGSALSGKMSGVAWEADTDKGQAGFTPGNPMTFRYFARRGGEAAVYEASH
ncbi:MAG TPA: LamG-like jellyroll fold domain-containing protein, partial [Candidatus Marinimicrobia bacterium]|nr:LamG-like jellyroll fold domain-containing protein [Candidatus Neomarinimicrobiota bacterium]